MRKSKYPELAADAYMREKGIRFYKRGGYTLEAVGYASGTPDESYSIDIKREVPDIVIEIIITSALLIERSYTNPSKYLKSGFEVRVYTYIPFYWGGEYEEVERWIFPQFRQSSIATVMSDPIIMML